MINGVMYLFVSEWADNLTELGRGKHFIGDFLPPDELERFMETYSVSCAKISPFCKQLVV